MQNIPQYCVSQSMYVPRVPYAFICCDLWSIFNVLFCQVKKIKLRQFIFKVYSQIALQNTIISEVNLFLSKSFRPCHSESNSSLAIVCSTQLCSTQLCKVKQKVKPFHLIWDAAMSFTMGRLATVGTVRFSSMSCFFMLWSA